jgi:hypothetical protein
MFDIGAYVKPSTVSSFTLRAVIPSALALLLAVPPDTYAMTATADLLVSPDAMQKQMIDSASKRQKDVETVTSFLTTPVADAAMREAHFNPQQVRKAIPTLSDQELASLAARSADAQQKFAAGRLTRPELALIVVALVVLIVVIIVH